MPTCRSTCSRQRNSASSSKLTVSIRRATGGFFDERSNMAYRVLIINGSPNKSGCTARALKEVADTLHAEGVETEGVIHNLNTYGGYMNIVDKDDRSDRTFYDCLLQSYNESKQYRHGELVIYNGNHTGDPKLSGKIVMITAIRASLIEDFHGFYLLYQPVFKDWFERVTFTVK